MKAEESNFVSLIRQRREEGMLYVIREYGGLLQAIVRKRLFAMPDRVDECMNDIFLGIWKNIDSFDEKRSSFKNWAAGAARLEAIDYLRKYRRELSGVNLEDVEIASEDTALTALVDKELSEEVESVLACLKPKDRELLKRFYMDQEEIGAVSASLGMSPDNAYVRMNRSKKKLRRIFGTAVGKEC